MLCILVISLLCTLYSQECEQALSEKASIAETLGEMESAFQDSQEVNNFDHQACCNETRQGRI